MNLEMWRKTWRVGAPARGEKGFLLITALVLLAILSLVGTTAFILSSTDIKIGGNYRNSRKAFHAALGGAERGKEVLRLVNESNASPFTDPASFNAELVYYTAGNQTLTSGTLDGYAYTVKLSNDSFCPPYCDASGNPADSGGNAADSNNKVIITSTATGPNGVKEVVEIAVSLPPPPSAPPPLSIPTPPAAITLLGNSATFAGGDSNAKSLNGDDQCGPSAPLPVVAVGPASSLGGVQSSIGGTKPKTYHTKVNSALVDASTHMGHITKALTTGEMNNNGVVLDNAASLNNMVQTIHDSPQATVAPGGSTSDSVNLGTVDNLKVVVVNGDFTMNVGSSGAGLLVVKGQLTFNGNVNYTGIIMVIGSGRMIRSGGGNGTISGAVWVGNTAGADGIPGTADDAMGPATLDISGNGASNIQYCSSAVNNATGTTAPPPTYDPLIVKSFREIL